MESSYIVIRKVLPDTERTDIAIEIASIISGTEKDLDSVVSILRDARSCLIYNKRTSMFMMKFSIPVRDITTSTRIVRLLAKYMTSTHIRYIDGPPCVTLYPPLYLPKQFIRMSLPHCADDTSCLFGIVCVRGEIKMKFVKSGLFKSSKSTQNCCVLYEFCDLCLPQRMLNSRDAYQETEVTLSVGDVCLWKSGVLFTWCNPSPTTTSIGINLSVCSNFSSFCEWNLDTNTFNIGDKLCNVQEYDYRVNSDTRYSDNLHNKFMVNGKKAQHLVKKYTKRTPVVSASVISLSNIASNYI